MGSIYEYQLEYKSSYGVKVVPDFILYHGILYLSSSDTHFGYAESNKGSSGVIEYPNKASLESRIFQIHRLTPFTKNEGDLREPNIITLTDEEVQDIIDGIWNKVEQKYAVVHNGDVVDFRLNGYTVDSFYGNDTREKVTFVESSVDDSYDVYWEVAPVLVGDTWTQQWSGRQFTEYELGEYRIKRKNEINVERDSELNGGFQSAVLDDVADSDAISRQNIIGASVAALNSIVAGEPSYNMNWRTGTNAIKAISREDVISLGLELLAFVESVYSSSWTRKDSIDNLSTRVEIDEA